MLEFTCLLYVIDSDQRPDLNRHHWRQYLKSRTDLMVFSNRRPFQILRYMADLFVRVWVRAYISDVV
jgi:hypothetical protein